MVFLAVTVACRFSWINPHPASPDEQPYQGSKADGRARQLFDTSVVQITLFALRILRCEKRLKESRKFQQRKYLVCLICPYWPDQALGYW